MDLFSLTDEQTAYIRRLSYRYTQLRKSSIIDADDLIAVAKNRWWQFCVRLNQEGSPWDFDALAIIFRQQVKFAMRDAVRNSYPVKVTRSYQQKLQAYQMPNTISIDHALDITSDDGNIDQELWMDVMNALKELSHDEQLLLSLHIKDGYNFTEIAYVLDVAVSTITRRYQKTIEKLKKKLDVSR
ncbi:sigma-70 family RNA polymerase sigma factor [Ferroacidibacillus organovorans]|uniref:RNA polymerase sigma-70 region 4 domain-containing protein n=1 Tax=Ferroacidibacillus organovorans TaxID=1765683 RepID=A0A162UFU7_9BACL|nr:sigma-70 family RNA polymerase sigma factor [Ferroacidibacillus organovorans]KYP81722.1 hypothetical protein AYJ22_06275 [Ferroacidibacillus organovorans]OAG94262.1 hypothetical protein AYW79_06500 [Ferroacidibacillus organovorans]OPG16903.1 hypothetical protein B2M26_04065 [Ferroacidibacillus organovorans]